MGHPPFSGEKEGHPRNQKLLFYESKGTCPRQAWAWRPHCGYLHFCAGGERIGRRCVRDAPCGCPPSTLFRQEVWGAFALRNSESAVGSNSTFGQNFTFLIRSIASFKRSAPTVTARRRNPSPCSLIPAPGMTTTSASSSRRFATVHESHPAGHLDQT